MQVRILPQGALLLTQAQAVGDHGDELGIRRLALDVRHGVTEKLLQNLYGVFAEFIGVAQLYL